MKLTFFGGIKEVTGSNYMIESGGVKILIDCGLKQSGHFADPENWDPFPYDLNEISAVFVTHAHIDHTGRLPKLIRDGYRGKIYSTPPTKDFAQLLLLDSENILQKEAEQHSREQLYLADDVMELMTRWEGLEYYRDFNIGGIKVKLYNAGHILGSSIIEVEADGKKILFTGDLGNNPPPIIKGTDFFEEADYCVIESAYGARIHEPTQPGIIEDLIEDVAKFRSVLMIPAFAMERTQKLLYEMNGLFKEGRVPRIPVFLDSPLAIEVTDIYKKYTDYFNEETLKEVDGHFSLFDFPGLQKTLTTEESKSINSVPPPKVIIAGSGMSQGGRILHHEMRYLSDPKSIILFVGYQSKGSLGRKIKEGAPSVKIHGEDVNVKCRIVSIESYSAHADQKQLLAWLEPMKFDLKNVFVVQGDDEGSSVLVNKIKDQLAIRAEIPEGGKTYEL
ncbi:MAG: MBL fold metallo-hydrolase [Patescibacteria group bacterium]|nr:MBL fold metallo-hydrolase [Patescibacteria group bacterium]